jgi:hypothetical protein
VKLTYCNWMTRNKNPANEVKKYFINAWFLSRFASKVQLLKLVYLSTPGFYTYLHICAKFCFHVNSYRHVDDASLSYWCNIYINCTSVISSSKMKQNNQNNSNQYVEVEFMQLGNRLNEFCLELLVLHTTSLVNMKHVFVLCMHECFALNLVNYEEQKTLSNALI